MAIPDLQGELWAWVQALPPWQSDLLRRISAVDVFDAEELAEAKQMILTAFAAGEPGVDKPVEPIPIPALGPHDPSSVARIVALSQLVAVGSTPAGQRLDFAPNGLTRVYGENGSGKSSYARVLRKACRASASPVEILPNVLKSAVASANRAGTAQIDILTNDVASVIHRDVNSLPEAELSHVSFFDSDCASTYAENENVITYVPSSLRLLERLVTLQAHLRKRIEEETAKLETQRISTKGFDVNTKAGALVAQLNENVNPATVKSLAKVSPEETKRLEELREQVKVAQASDPIKVAEGLENKAAAAERLAVLVSSLTKAMGPSVVSELIVLNQRAAKLAQASAKLSAALSDASVREVGGARWKALWQAARVYLGEISEVFPPAEGANRTFCALCQQELSGEAVARMRRFEEFFRGEVEAEAADVSVQRGRIGEAIGKLSATEEKLFSEAGLLFHGEPLESSVQRFVKAAALRRSAIQCAISATEIAVPEFSEDPSKHVLEWATVRRRMAAEQRALAAPAAVQKAKVEIAELENRILLGERLKLVLTSIAIAKRANSLRKAIAALATTGLSKRIGEFTESAVTTQLRARLMTELSEASLDHLPVGLGARSPKGKTHVSIQLDTTRKDVRVAQILSEGERRAVAIAFFLAEVAVLEHSGGIVLDDPVSSLDHARRSYVARRVVEEAASRQAIVFTHDVVFLLELQELAKAAGIPTHVRVVRRVGNEAGVASAELPWITQNVKQRVGYLKNKLQQLEALERKGEAEEYRYQVKTWFSLLREAWERVVEEKLFNGVVGRFQPEIKTLSLHEVSVTEQQTGAVHKGMTEASKWVHDQAAALNRPPPKAKDLKAALDELEAFNLSLTNKPKPAKPS